MPALGVRQSAVIQNLKHYIEYVRMRFFYLVKENDGIRPVPDKLGQLPAFFVPDITRRRADYFGRRNAVPYIPTCPLVSKIFVIEHKLRQSFGQFGLAHARRT